ncbi:DUF397 domain-containing protein [Streptomyces sp. HSG2]|uniref:DUF397 domain-containing protein n=1 Tax=Streptomyces sp. HSG2 TaxID=2797167 RepID=UPI001F5B224F|nr:DUF397 domain-containing protein [Streptomyces sp. HSG2]
MRRHRPRRSADRPAVAVRARVVRVRDSEDIVRPGLVVGAAAWGAFVGFVVR